MIVEENIILWYSQEDGVKICDTRGVMKETLKRILVYLVHILRICRQFVLRCALLWLDTDNFTRIFYVYFNEPGATLRFPKCRWSSPNGFSWIYYFDSMRTDYITTAKQSTFVWIFYGIYCKYNLWGVVAKAGINDRDK